MRSQTFYRAIFAGSVGCIWRNVRVSLRPGRTGSWWQWIVARITWSGRSYGESRCSWRRAASVFLDNKRLEVSDVTNLLLFILLGSNYLLCDWRWDVTTTPAPTLTGDSKEHEVECLVDEVIGGVPSPGLFRLLRRMDDMLWPNRFSVSSRSSSIFPSRSLLSTSSHWLPVLVAGGPII